MTVSNLLCDSVCTHCGLARFKIISTGRGVLKCFGCGSVKCSGYKEDVLHIKMHEQGGDDISSVTIFRGTA